MIYERVSRRGTPNFSSFLYTLHRNGANHIEVGVGFESNDGLQKTHIPGVMMHLSCVKFEMENVRQRGLYLRTGKLSYFFDEQDFYVPDTLEREFLARAMLSVACHTHRDGKSEMWFSIDDPRRQISDYPDHLNRKERS